MEIHFDKYETRTPDYHYKQINKRDWHHFNAYVYARYQIELNLIDILSKDKKESLKILDMGCGDAALYYLFNQRFKKNSSKLYGIDPSEPALKIAKQKNPKVQFKISDAYNVPFPDNYFDLVVSSDVIEHLLYPEKMIIEINRVAKKGAYVIIGTPIRYTEYPLDKAHQKEYFPDEFQFFLSKFFNKVKILQSHLLMYRELYNYRFSLFKWKRLIFRILINFLSIYFNKNVFLRIKRMDNKLYSYMFAIAQTE